MIYTHICGEHVPSVAAALVHLVTCPREAYFRPDRRPRFASPAQVTREMTDWVQPRPLLSLVDPPDPTETRITRTGR